MEQKEGQFSLQCEKMREDQMMNIKLIKAKILRNSWIFILRKLTFTPSKTSTAHSRTEKIWFYRDGSVVAEVSV